VLFLAFDPGNNSILNAAGAALAKNPDLFVRGALTNAQRASQFSQSLHQGGGADADGSEKQGVAVVGEMGGPKKKGAKATKKGGKQPAAPIDYRAIPAGSVNAHDAFGAWEAEMQRYGFAIIHNKIVVIDPFSDNCVVVTGSHNLGFRASHNNDENLVIIHGHRGLAEAYACHVLDIYDHYAWRYWLQKDPDIFGKPLEPDDKWQERYIMGPNLKSPEMRFWLAAATSGNAAPLVRAPGRTPAATPGKSGKSAAPASPKAKSTPRKRNKPASHKAGARKRKTKSAAAKKKKPKLAKRRSAKTRKGKRKKR
jgi:PLD-like domain